MTSNNRTVKVDTGISSDLDKKIAKAAKQNGMSKAALLRLAIIEGIKTDKIKILME